MRTAAIGLFLALATTTAVSAGPLPPAKTRLALADAQNALDNELLDFTTARFKSVRLGATPIGAAPFLCGYVNGKNSMGAYIGWRLFVWQSWATEPIILEGSDGDNLESISNQCSVGFVDEVDYSKQIAYSGK